MVTASFRDVAINYLRPWKLVTLFLGFSFLFWGAHYEIAPDWDFGISVIMGLLTYLTAPWSARVVINREWSKLPVALSFYYITVDLVYVIYWNQVNPNALFMRPANFFASSCMYWLCGFIWIHNGSLSHLLQKKELL